MLGSGFTTHRHAVADNNIAQWNAMLMEVRDLRRFGSAALDLAFVAAGKLDGFWETRLNSWDCLAGILLVQEAGGTTTDYIGGDGGSSTAGARSSPPTGRSTTAC